MKTESELEGIATNFHYGANSFHFHDWLPGATKQLRQIQIDALREAREMVEKHSIWAADHDTDEPVNIPNPALPELDKLIRDLELR